MAGDWIKIEHTLPTKPEVFGIARRVGQSRTEIIARLLMLWIWADQNAVGGADLALKATDLDEIVGLPGMADAMRAEGWLSGEDGSLQLPNFERHNGSSAKARALEAEAKRLRRSSDKQAGNTSDNGRTKHGPDVRPEKRREEKSIKESARACQMGGGAPEEPKSDALPTLPPDAPPEPAPRTAAALVAWWNTSVRSICPELPIAAGGPVLEACWLRVADHPALADLDALRDALARATWWRTERPTWGLLKVLAMDADGPRAAKILAGAYANRDVATEKAAAVESARVATDQAERDYRQRFEADRSAAAASAQEEQALEAEWGPQFDELGDEVRAAMEAEVLEQNAVWKRLRTRPMVKALIRQACLVALRDNEG